MSTRARSKRRRRLHVRVGEVVLADGAFQGLLECPKKTVGDGFLGDLGIMGQAAQMKWWTRTASLGAFLVRATRQARKSSRGEGLSSLDMGDGCAVDRQTPDPGLFR